MKNLITKNLKNQEHEIVDAKAIMLIRSLDEELLLLPITWHIHHMSDAIGNCLEDLVDVVIELAFRGSRVSFIPMHLILTLAHDLKIQQNFETRGMVHMIFGSLRIEKALLWKKMVS